MSYLERWNHVAESDSGVFCLENEEDFDVLRQLRREGDVFPKRHTAADEGERRVGVVRKPCKDKVQEKKKKKEEKEKKRRKKDVRLTWT